MIMGLDAQVIAIGPFSEELLPAMEYGPRFYADVAAGQTIVVNVFVASASPSLRELALAFGVGPMELGKHHLDPNAADLQQLKTLFDEKKVNKFLLLKARGFEFYYLPNA
jgi:hypothetical protein